MLINSVFKITFEILKWRWKKIVTSAKKHLRQIVRLCTEVIGSEFLFYKPARSGVIAFDLKENYFFCGCGSLYCYFDGINFRGINFRGINFREPIREILVFRGINFRESPFFKQIHGINFRGWHPFCPIFFVLMHFFPKFCISRDKLSRMWHFTFFAGQTFANVKKIREIRESLSLESLSHQSTNKYWVV